ncbi:MAG: AMP-binding protein [Gemmatimonadota bacterium]|jgi:fatty-acyl-CoA synthase|nr:AMP-binding protein [Gemmatimonadota bacterium]
MALSQRFRGHSVADVISSVAREQPRHPCLILGDRRYTYGQVDAYSAALASALHELGVEKGDRIALNLPNWPEFIISMFAAARLGATIIPLNPKYTTQELQYMLRHSEAVVCVTAEAWEGVDYLSRFEGFLHVLPDLQYILAVGEEDLWYDDRIYQFEDLVSSGEGRPLPPVEVDPDNPFAIVYTSGTMGKPKGVTLTHTNLLSSALASADALRLVPEDVVFGVTSLFNVFGLAPGVLGTMAAGATLVLQEGSAPVDALRVIEEQRVTVYHGVPTSFILDLHSPDLASYDRSSLRTGIIAGAPVPEDLVRRVHEELVPEVLVAYGLTETGSVLSITRADDPPAQAATTVGRPVDGVEVRILDFDGSVLPVESIGEIAVRGAGVMRGYYRQPGETAQVFTEDGYFLTGDLGMVDEEGYLHIVGRRKEIIIRGGFNVYPREVEDRLHAHPAVLDVAVVGLPHEVLGEVACACIVLVEGAIVTGDEITDFCREVLADYKVPDLVRFLDSFPMTGSGKVRRVELARMISAEESSRR